MRSVKNFPAKNSAGEALKEERGLYSLPQIGSQLREPVQSWNTPHRKFPSAQPGVFSISVDAICSRGQSQAFIQNGARTLQENLYPFDILVNLVIVLAGMKQVVSKTSDHPQQKLDTRREGRSHRRPLGEGCAIDDNLLRRRSPKYLRMPA